MGKLAERITAAETKLNTAKESNDEAAQRVAEAELSTLRSLDSEGWVPQTDVSGSAASARTEGRSAGETAERERIRKLYGLSEEDDLDAAIKADAERRRNEQSEADRLKGEVESLKADRDTAQSSGETYESLYKKSLADAALERELISQGVRTSAEDSRLSMAVANTDRSKVQVDLETDENGNVTGGTVSGASEAAKATAEAIPEWFGSTTNKQGPPEAPEDKGGRVKGQSAYKPNYSRPA